MLTFRVQHFRDVEVLLSHVEGGHQVLHRVILVRQEAEGASGPE